MNMESAIAANHICNNLSKLIATIHSIDANIQCIILKEEDVNTTEKISAIKTQTDDVIRIIDCTTVSADINKLLFANTDEYEPKHVIMYFKDRIICTPDRISKHMLKSVLYGNEMHTCQICDREYGDEEKRRSCGQCAYHYCYQCGVHMTMQAIINGTNQGDIKCPQCRAGDNILFATVLDDELRIMIPEEYITPFIKKEDLNDVRCMALNMLAALLIYQFNPDQEIIDLIEELLTCKAALRALPVYD